MSEANIFKISPQSKRVIAETEQWKLIESVFTLERTDEAPKNVARVTYEQLLFLESDNEYIDLSDAHKITGISENKLIELCTSGKLKARRSGSRWTIQLKSLRKYLG